MVTAWLLRVDIKWTIEQAHEQRVRITVLLEGSDLWCTPAKPQTACGFQQKLEKQETREIGPRSNPNSDDSLKNHLRTFTKDILKKVLEISIRMSLCAIYCLYSVYIYVCIYY